MAAPMFHTKPLVRSSRDWKSLLRTATPVKDTAVLDRRHIYILPTRQGLLLVLVLICMLTGSINYALSLGFVLTFLIAGLGVIAMLHTWRNLVYLSIAAGKTSPVFAGEEANFRLVAADRHTRVRYAIGIFYRESQTVFFDIPADGCTELTISIKSTKRGWLLPGRLTLHTEFPLGLFHAWSYVELGNRCLVYPRPANSKSMPLASGADGKAGITATASGADDFSGLRHYQHGDSMRRIDWKASAREQGMFTKQFHGGNSSFLWLEWQLTEGDTESRISQLTRWVMDAHTACLSYGLRLPGVEIHPTSGEQHYRMCLETLALFGNPQ
jgi:uncharacterized protein (DUF58 family)